MNPDPHIQDLLDGLEDAGVVFLGTHATAPAEDPPKAAYIAATRSANEAYAAWRSTRTTATYAAYAAARDQADAAQDALAKRV